MHLRSAVFVAIPLLASAPFSFGQQTPPVSEDPQANRALQATSDDAAAPAVPASEHKRIFGIIPNYRTYPTLAEYKPISAGEKFKIAVADSFDRGSVILAAAFAGKGQLANENPSFGQGVGGYARYFAAGYSDVVIGNFMTEAIYPALLHQDPRYFRRGTGTGISRLGYAVGQIFWTHKDSGGSQFNYSEVLGNATAAAISNAYYPDNRTAGNAVSKLSVQLGIDMASNILKEFWPDLDRKLSRKHQNAKQDTTGY
ncbi:MAG: hypothetical protein JO323_06755 [Acidobacteriia bacterium]|nr:hypothetical protein [Terriglobia bacterium]